MFKDAIAAHARRAPDARAIVTPAGAISYVGLDRAIDALRHRLGALEPPPGAVIGLWIADPIAYWAAALALDHLGLISFSFFGAPLDIQAARLVRPWKVLTDRAERPPGEHFLFVPPQWLGEPAPPAPLRPPAPDEPVRILLSSGTTGVAKQILRTRGMLLDRARDLADHDLPENVRAICLFRPYTGLGSTLPLAVFLKGGALITDERQAWDPALWDHQPNFAALTPVLLRSVLLSMPDGRGPDPQLTVLVGGAATPRALQRAALERLTPNLIVRYGASETGMIAQTSTDVLDRYETAAGRVLADAEVEIVDAQDQPLGPDQVGAIRIRTPSMVQGYRNDPERTRQHFRDGWFYPGDQGRLTTDRVLVLEGRASEVMNFGGSKIAPDDVERAALADPGVADAAAFALNDAHGLPQLWVAVTPGPGYAEPALQARLHERLAIRPIRIAVLRKIPRNASGKIQRDLLKTLVTARGGRRGGARR